MAVTGSYSTVGCWPIGARSPPLSLIESVQWLISAGSPASFLAVRLV